MVKWREIRISNAWTVVIVAALMCGAVLLFFYLQIAPHQAELVSYQQAKTCQGKPGCGRQIQKVIILLSETRVDFFSVPSGRGRSRTLSHTESHFKFDMGGRPIESHIFTKVSLTRDLFDLPNIYLPSETESEFAQINFPQGKEIQVEVWNGRITFIFADRVGHFWGNNSIGMAEMTPAPLYISASKEPTGPKFAIPTSDHPVATLKKAQQDLLSTFLLVVMVMFCVIVLARQFRKSFWRPIDASSH